VIIKCNIYNFLLFKITISNEKNVKWIGKMRDKERKKKKKFYRQIKILIIILLIPQKNLGEMNLTKPTNITTIK